MGTVTWLTAPIPAYQLTAGDRIHFGGSDVTLTGVAESGSTVTVEVNGCTFGLDPHAEVAVHVPDEPVDGYTLWRPKATTWVSGCICVHRRHPTLAGNWEQISWDTDCPEHGIHDQYDY